MPNPTRIVQHDVELLGCTPEPLMSYLKALGILRLVSDQVDPNARGWWKNDVFWIRSTLDRDAMVKFFLEVYSPTPIVVPWSGGDFFAVNWNVTTAPRHKKTPTASTVIESFLATTSGRLERYRAALHACKVALEICGIETSHTEDSSTLKSRQAEFKKLKWTFIGRLRATCGQLETLDWIDAAAVTGTEAFAPLLGSGGGSDGNTNFADNFMQNLWDVLADFDIQRHGASHAAALRAASVGGLRESLFREASTYRVLGRTSSLFDAGAVGGPNATQGMERESLLNPWDMIIGLEGTPCFAAAAVKRLASQAVAGAGFPFQFSASPTRRDGLADKESAGREIWLPLWHRPCKIGEILNLFREGRAETASGPVRNGVDMGRAIVTLGIDRGVASFHRYGILRGRVGGENYNTAASLGRFALTERSEAELLREIDPWLDRFERACSGDNVPARFTRALRAIDSAIFDFCMYGGNSHFQEILATLGAAEREMARTPGKIGQSKSTTNPLAGLSSAWIDAARVPDRGEFEIALALTGIEDPSHTIGPFRSNLEPVTLWRNGEGKIGSKWAEQDRASVWNAADLFANLAAVLDRRVMDGARKGYANLSLGSSSAASPATIAAFLEGELDERKVEGLLWGLMLIDRSCAPGKARLHDGGAAGSSQAPPPIYDLLKLLFLPSPLFAARSANGAVHWRLATAQETGIRIRPEPAILPLLRLGRVGDAAAIAMRRLRSAGLNPLPHSRAGRPSRDSEWSEVDLSPREGQRLAAALLIPLRADALNPLVHRATSARSFNEVSSATTATSDQ